MLPYCQGHPQLHAVWYSVHLWYVQLPYLPFFPRRWLFHAPWYKWSPCSDFPYPHLRTTHEISSPKCRCRTIRQNWQTLTARGRKHLAVLAIAFGFARPRAFYSASSGCLSRCFLASLLFLAAIVAWFGLIVLLSIHIYRFIFLLSYHSYLCATSIFQTRLSQEVAWSSKNFVPGIALQSKFWYNYSSISYIYQHNSRFPVNSDKL